jgi:hypothetical protein
MKIMEDSSSKLEVDLYDIKREDYNLSPGILNVCVCRIPLSGTAYNLGLTAYNQCIKQRVSCYE